MIPALIYIFVSSILVVLFAAFAPTALSDQHPFLKSFIGANFLSLMGVILTITIASLSQLHLNLNEFEKLTEKKLPRYVRREIFSNVKWLLGIFAVSFSVVLFKPMAEDSAASQTIFNGTALILMGLYFLILVDIAQTVFVFEPTEEEVAPAKEDPKQVE